MLYTFFKEKKLYNKIKICKTKLIINYASTRTINDCPLFPVDQLHAGFNTRKGGNVRKSE